MTQLPEYENKQRVDDSGRCSFFSCAPQQGQEGWLSVQHNASEPCLVTDGLEMREACVCPNLSESEADIFM